MIGITLSHRQLSLLGLSTENAFATLRELNMRLIRIGFYWDEIEKRPGIYDFIQTDKLLDLCHKMHIAAIVTIGMKAPRHPEYYIPLWLKKNLALQKNSVLNAQKNLVKNLFSFISACVNRYKTSSIITHWQIENEPLDPSGPLWMSIHPELLQREVLLVKKLDPAKPVILTFWGNELSKRNLYHQIPICADVVGVDLYKRVPSFSLLHKRIISGPHDSDEKLQSIFRQIRSAGKKLWISELQAEPWTYPETFLPHHMIENIEWSKQFGAEHTLLWGYEFWLAQKQKGNGTYINEAIKMLAPK